MFQQHFIAEARELFASASWLQPDWPSAAKIPELASRIDSPDAYRALRASPEFEFLVALIEDYEFALNDDWLPRKIADLSLSRARQFIGLVAQELSQHDFPLAAARLKEQYLQILKQERLDHSHGKSA
jgi:hypothetical protein